MTKAKQKRLRGKQAKIQVDHCSYSHFDEFKTNYLHNEIKKQSSASK